MKRALALLLVAPAFAACSPPPETPALGCDAPLLTDLGYLTDDNRFAFFTTSGGRVRFSVTNPYEGSVLAPPDDRTIYVGDAGTAPEYESAESGRIVNAVDSVRVDPEHPGTLDLEPGDYWVVSHSAPTTMAACPGTTISGVVPAPGTVATTTPSPTASQASPARK